MSPSKLRPPAHLPLRPIPQLPPQHFPNRALGNLVDERHAPSKLLVIRHLTLPKLLNFVFTQLARLHWHDVRSRPFFVVQGDANDCSISEVWILQELVFELSRCYLESIDFDQLFLSIDNV